MSEQVDELLNRRIDEFYRQHADALFAYCRGLVRDYQGDCYQDAEDLLQEVFRLVHTKVVRDAHLGAAADHKSESEFLLQFPRPAQQAWLRSTARNLNHTRMRSRWRAAAVPVDLDLVEDSPVVVLGTAGEPRAPDQAAEDVALAGALKVLPHQTQVIVKLLVVEQLTTMEIVAALGISRAHVTAALETAVPCLLEVFPELARRWRGEFDRWKDPHPSSPLDKALCRLTLRRREVVERFARGKSHAQIAAELGIKAGCVRVHLHNAVADLMKHLGTDRAAVLDLLFRREHAAA